MSSIIFIDLILHKTKAYRHLLFNVFNQESVNIQVGDSKRWSVYDSEFYYQWSKEKQFHVGDSLLFENNNKVNDVFEISGDLEFLYCDPISPVAVHKTGHDLVKLTEPGIHYFISSEPGHCEAGLKLQVVVGPTANVPKLSPLERLTRWLDSFMFNHH
ncbi:hypothetical protein ARALYDRAFT_351911 [Arabidopsis lyrata subsp. lyrata]|uniref:Phytocyanin domain-containing protein n=1 Tax=Arabidopsis lyrata subsp. lyrata TaxID=81972 RepID=D7M7R6_ARALL|nr:hypothetical protein ARALYDRAFT_351911 [Arabidopsis lyrata subsp. lyrata]